MRCPACGNQLETEDKTFVWDDIEKRSIRICENLNCIQAFRHDLKKRHKKPASLKKL